jgi:hypothetical protein
VAKPALSASPAWSGAKIALTANAAIVAKARLPRSYSTHENPRGRGRDSHNRENDTWWNLLEY